MPKDTYNLVEWILEHRDFSFDHYVDDETKDKIKEKSSEEFFKRGIDIAIKYAPTRKEDSKAPDKKASLRDWEKIQIRERDVAEMIEREESIREDIDAIEDLGDLDNVKRRIKRLEKSVDVSDLEGRIEEIGEGLKAQREAEREERTRIMLEQQAEAKEKRLAKLKEIEKTGGGVSPDF